MAKAKKKGAAKNAAPQGDFVKDDVVVEETVSKVETEQAEPKKPEPKKDTKTTVTNTGKSQLVLCDGSKVTQGSTISVDPIVLDHAVTKAWITAGVLKVN